MFKLRNILLLGIITLLTSCNTGFFDSATDVYCSHSCNFTFCTTWHQSQILTSSVTGYCGFCKVYKNLDQGVNKVFIEKYGEKTESYAYTIEGEGKVSDLVIGYKNGLLLGYSALDNCILAFDLYCPTCENKGGKLEWNGSSTSVKCPICKKIYDLSSSSTGLNRYPASYSYNERLGTYFLRVVQN